MNAVTKIQQQGATLFTAMIFLLILTLVGLTALRNSGLSERMSANAQINQMAFNAAESAMDRYIAEYNYNVNTPVVTETEISNKVLRLAKYLPTADTDGWLEYCIDDNTSVIEQITDTVDGSGSQIFETEVNCGTKTIDGAQQAVTAKSRVTYKGCPGSCPKYSLGLGKQKVSCHVLMMEAEGAVQTTSASVDQWISLQGPC